MDNHKAGELMSDVDDLVAAMVKGDPEEVVPLELITDMAQAAIDAHFIPCPHADFVTVHTTTLYDRRGTIMRTCERCGAHLVVEDTDG
jgi:hypothetical protein